MDLPDNCNNAQAEVELELEELIDCIYLSTGNSKARVLPEFEKVETESLEVPSKVGLFNLFLMLY